MLLINLILSVFLATVGVIVEMMELAYLTNVLQLLRQRSHNLEQMFVESRRRYEEDPSRPIRRSFYPRDDHSTSLLENPGDEQNEPFRLAQEFRPPSFRLSSRRQQQSGEREGRSSSSTDPLDFNHFMDDVYSMFPFYCIFLKQFVQ